MATTFQDIQDILQGAVNNQTIGVHGNFWLNHNGSPMTRDTFVGLSIFGCKLIDNTNWNPAESGIIQILSSNQNMCQQNQMPQGGFPPLSADKIKTIADWIAAECPDGVSA